MLSKHTYPLIGTNMLQQIKKNIRIIRTRKIVVLTLMILLQNSVYSQEASKKMPRKIRRIYVNVNRKISEKSRYEIKIDSLEINKATKQVTFFMNNQFSYIPFRPVKVQELKNLAEKQLRGKFKKYSVSLETFGQDISELIPNIYRKDYLPIDSLRLTRKKKEQIPLIRKLQNENQPKPSLYGKNIALWHSHGWYYENKFDRWEWQRAPVFQIIEDLWTMSFTIPYLYPMLENAGANILSPRERDTQTNEVIIDAEKSTSKSQYIEEGNNWESSDSLGFALKYPFLFDGENPFKMGKSRRTKSDTIKNALIQYIADIPETGWYGIYISYENNSENITDAHYKIYHTGGKTEYLVNQTMGGGTWIYLGTFHFLKGINPEQGKIELSNKSSEKNKWVSADAVKIGGGMGNIVRGKEEYTSKLKKLREQPEFIADTTQWKQFVSGKPRYQEAARYYLQYAGMPDTLVYALNSGESDYRDDHQSRGEWVNYLMGAPNGPQKNPNAKGLNIPISMAMAFHTDAGITPNDSIIGTLAIYSTTGDSAYFPNGQSKWASRDLSDIVQTQIISDIQKLYEPKWTRRGMRNRQYSEAFRPKVPSLLLELLSHQNFSDLYHALDPDFRFHVSRSIYKGILKFLTFQDGKEYIVQPLPVNHFKMIFEGDSLRLSWKPILDDLEPTAKPEAYKIYTRKENLGFDNGQIVNDTTILIPMTEARTIYSFKIKALNKGGESFPSEILSYCRDTTNKKPVLIINAFDRISAPAAFDNGKQAGFIAYEDEGVPYHKELAFIGEQYNFDRESSFEDDDAPGFGASYMDKTDKSPLGNSFDFTIVHGQALRNNGYGFISMSDEAFEKQQWNPDEFAALNIIFGEEKTTEKFYGINKKKYSLYTPKMRESIKKYLSGKKPRLLISGAYVGADLRLCGDTLAKNFAKETLHYKRRTNHADRVGEVYAAIRTDKFFNGRFHFNTTYHPEIYKVESPDAIEPAGKGAVTLFRYKSNNKSAGVKYDGEHKSVILGFPLETIVTSEERTKLTKQIFEFFEKETPIYVPIKPIYAPINNIYVPIDIITYQ